jgi:hypothetical protein
MKKSSAPVKKFTAGWGTTCLLFLVVLVVLLHGVFLPGHTLASNDGPLGELMAQCHRLPDRFTGCWADVGGLGLNAGAAPANLSLGLQWLLGPLWFSRLYAILSLLLLGTGAWYFLRQSRLTSLACILGGLAAMLNSTFFSVACWGMSPHVLAAALSFFALGALLDPSPRGRWLRVILAGFAVGMCVAEGADVGAIFSLYVAAFIVYQAWIAEGPRASNLAGGFGRLTLVTVCAAFLATQAVYDLVNTSIKGVVQGRQDTQNTTNHWDWATQWSLPKKETLGLVVPGLFGYRMDTLNGGEYWGKIGRSPAWDRYTESGSQGAPPTGFIRYTGTGYYEGVVLVMVAFWAAIQSLRRRDSIFNIGQRKWLWFWLGIAVVSLLLGLGRFAPFYRLMYALPYFSTIRNPIKFIYLFSFALIVLFAFGVDGLQRKYMPAAGAALDSRRQGFKGWWRRATRLEKNWIYGCVLIWVLTLVGWVIYAHEQGQMQEFLRSTQIAGDVVAIVSFSVQRIGWFLLYFLLSAGTMALIFSGAFTGKWAKAGGLLLGWLLVTDLALANQPWVIYWDTNDKFATNPVIDPLRDQPYEHRVALAPVNLPAGEIVLRQIYDISWAQHQFPYYNIQSFDTVELPRMPEDLAAFKKAFQRKDTNQPYFPTCRAWQLTNTRYVLAPAHFGQIWNQVDYLVGDRLQTVNRFDFTPKVGITKPNTAADFTPITMPAGKFALFEYSNALPRVKLYSQWQVNTNNDSALEQIFSPQFDPQSTVLIDSGGLPSDSATANTNSTAGTVDFASYAPKDLVLKAEVSTPSVLLLNDRYDPNWKVLVDSKPAELLRCNYLMRGVHLMPGEHTVEFKFQPPYNLIFVSLSAIALGVLTLGVLLVVVNKTPAPDPKSDPRPQAPPAPAAVPTPKPRNGKKAAVAR